MKYREGYDYGKEQLQQAEIADAKLDARLLLEYICHTDRNTLLAHGDREVTEAECNSYVNLIKQRKRHIPLQYLTGEQDFMGLHFQVSPAVLIPRQDTEILVEEVMRDLHDGMSILDLCTGSGCILISLLHYTNDCTGTGVDISSKALEVAKKNAKRLVETEKITFIESDLFTQVQGSFDRIVSNPPYIASEMIKTLMSEVKDHEPMLALDGMVDGLFFYREIIANAHRHLNGGGMLFLEIGFDQAEAVSRLMEQNGFTEVTVVKDLAGLDRVVHGTLAGRH